MSDLKDIDRTTEEYLAPTVEGETSPEHSAWMKSEIEATLAKKKAGEMTYRSLDEVMQDYGFNAR